MTGPGEIKVEPIQDLLKRIIYEELLTIGILQPETSSNAKNSNYEIITSFETGNDNPLEVLERLTHDPEIKARIKERVVFEHKKQKAEARRYAKIKAKVAELQRDKIASVCDFQRKNYTGIDETVLANVEFKNETLPMEETLDLDSIADRKNFMRRTLGVSEGYRQKELLQQEKEEEENNRMEKEKSEADNSDEQQKEDRKKDTDPELVDNDLEIVNNIEKKEVVVASVTHRKHTKNTSMTLSNSYIKLPRSMSNSFRSNTTCVSSNDTSATMDNGDEQPVLVNSLRSGKKERQKSTITDVLTVADLDDSSICDTQKISLVTNVAEANANENASATANNTSSSKANNSNNKSPAIYNNNRKLSSPTTAFNSDETMQQRPESSSASPITNSTRQLKGPIDAYKNSFYRKREQERSSINKELEKITFSKILPEKKLKEISEEKKNRCCMPESKVAPLDEISHLKNREVIKEEKKRAVNRFSPKISVGLITQDEVESLGSSVNSISPLYVNNRTTEFKLGQTSFLVKQTKNQYICSKCKTEACIPDQDDEETSDDKEDHNFSHNHDSQKQRLKQDHWNDFRIKEDEIISDESREASDSAEEAFSVPEKEEDEEEKQKTKETIYDDTKEAKNMDINDDDLKKQIKENLHNDKAESCSTEVVPGNEEERKNTNIDSSNNQENQLPRQQQEEKAEKTEDEAEEGEGEERITNKEIKTATEKETDIVSADNTEAKVMATTAVENPQTKQVVIDNYSANQPQEEFTLSNVVEKEMSLININVSLKNSDLIVDSSSTTFTLPETSDNLISSVISTHDSQVNEIQYGERSGEKSEKDIFSYNHIAAVYDPVLKSIRFGLSTDSGCCLISVPQTLIYGYAEKSNMLTKNQNKFKFKTSEYGIKFSVSEIHQPVFVQRVLQQCQCRTYWMGFNENETKSSKDSSLSSGNTNVTIDGTATTSVMGSTMQSASQKKDTSVITRNSGNNATTNAIITTSGTGALQNQSSLSGQDGIESVVANNLIEPYYILVTSDKDGRFRLWREVFDKPPTEVEILTKIDLFISEERKLSEQIRAMKDSLKKSTSSNGDSNNSRGDGMSLSANNTNIMNSDSAVRQGCTLAQLQNKLQLLTKERKLYQLKYSVINGEHFRSTDVQTVADHCMIDNPLNSLNIRISDRAGIIDAVQILYSFDDKEAHEVVQFDLVAVTTGEEIKLLNAKKTRLFSTLSAAYVTSAYPSYPKLHKPCISVIKAMNENANLLVIIKQFGAVKWYPFETLSSDVLKRPNRSHNYSQDFNDCDQFDQTDQVQSSIKDEVKQIDNVMTLKMVSKYIDRRTNEFSFNNTYDDLSKNTPDEDSNIQQNYERLSRTTDINNTRKNNVNTKSGDGGQNTNDNDTDTSEISLSAPIHSNRYTNTNDTAEDQETQLLAQNIDTQDVGMAADATLRGLSQDETTIFVVADSHSYSANHDASQVFNNLKMKALCVSNPLYEFTSSVEIDNSPELKSERVILSLERVYNPDGTKYVPNNDDNIGKAFILWNTYNNDVEDHIIIGNIKETILKMHLFPLSNVEDGYAIIVITKSTIYAIALNSGTYNSPDPTKNEVKRTYFFSQEDINAKVITRSAQSILDASVVENVIFTLTSKDIITTVINDISVSKKEKL